MHGPGGLVDELLHRGGVVGERRGALADGEPALGAAQIQSGHTGADAPGGRPWIDGVKGERRGR